MKTFQIRQKVIKLKSYFLSYMNLICQGNMFFVLCEIKENVLLNHTAKSTLKQIENCCTAVELAAYVQRFNFVKSAAHCAAHLTAARQRFKSAVIFSGSA